MFIGHFALAFAAKRVAPKASLGTLFAASQLLDLIWPPLVLLGVEEVRIDPGNTAVTPLDFAHYPWSHSLDMAIFWGALFGAGYFVIRRDGVVAAWLGLLVVSHWVLDWIVHRPDLPLWPHGPKVGLQLWNSLAGTLTVEGGLFALGVWAYGAGTVPRDRTGVVALWSLVGFLAVIYLGNLFGPPPPSATAVAASGLAIWLLVAWAAWADRHRLARIP
jgi:membrane-bound metal-dependent hydrolase YbcI (DUF457 family)